MKFRILGPLEVSGEGAARVVADPDVPPVTAQYLALAPPGQWNRGSSTPG
jgi:hypothetical protein